MPRFGRDRRHRGGFAGQAAVTARWLFAESLKTGDAETSDAGQAAVTVFVFTAESLEQSAAGRQNSGLSDTQC